VGKFFLKKPMGKTAEMRLIARALDTKGEEPHIVGLLRSDPKLAKQLGRSVERAREQFDAAYPGQTRDKTISNDDWEEAGHVGVAKLNHIMGFKRS
jgi:O-methyltransferase involved in polyketide biosynthesis